MTITARRKRQFCQALLSTCANPVGLADVGSGGSLKSPWKFLAGTHLRTFGFEPTEGRSDSPPLCISDRSGTADFHVAKDERASSLLRPNPVFVNRFALDSLNTEKIIRVACTTLDEYFSGRYRDIDAVDVNVEGHDLQVLHGGASLLVSGGVKLLKVEFELAEAWIGQGWFGEIDQLLRSWGYDLVGIDFESTRPVNSRHLYYPGEPVWGKALYVPSARLWDARIRAANDRMRDEVFKAVALYVAADTVGRAFDLLDLAASSDVLSATEREAVKEDVAQVYRWARIEKGVGMLGRLAEALLRRI